MCCSKVMNKMYLVQWLAIPYIHPLIFKQNPFLNSPHISEKAKKHTWKTRL